MSIEKINSALQVKFGSMPESQKKSEKPEIATDEEKSSSMNKKIGLCAAAAIAIGGIILYARKGRGVSTAGGGGASSAASSTTSSGSGSPAFEPIKKFMKKLEDGTEYLFRTEERDKDGNLVKSIRYAKDGKTIERVREFKMAPAGVTDPAHNVVASEIRYGKNGEIIYKRTANADLSGYDVERFADKENTLWANMTYATHFDGKRFRSVETSGIVTDAKTGRKIAEAQFGPNGEDDMVLMRRFDKKTGTKVVQEMQRLTDDTYKATEFGQGQSKQVSVHREVPGKADEVLQTERYDSKGRLRFLYTKTRDGSFTRVENPVKGRVTIIEEINGENFVTKKYKKKGEEYTQKFIVDNANPENNKLEVYKGDELVHTLTGA